jgi:hypothetical protein
LVNFLADLFVFVEAIDALTFQEMTFIGNLVCWKKKIQWVEHISLTPLTWNPERRCIGDLFCVLTFWDLLRPFWDQLMGYFVSQVWHAICLCWGPPWGDESPLGLSCGRHVFFMHPLVPGDLARPDTYLPCVLTHFYVFTFHSWEEESKAWTLPPSWVFSL